MLASTVGTITRRALQHRFFKELDEMWQVGRDVVAGMMWVVRQQLECTRVLGAIYCFLGTIWSFRVLVTGQRVINRLQKELQLLYCWYVYTRL